MVQVGASLVADLIRRRPFDRIVFNLAQLALSWLAAGLVLEALGGTGIGGPGGLEASDLPAIAICAVVFFAANSTLVRTAEALLQGAPIRAHLLGDLIFRSWSAATLFALGPPVAVIAENWLYLVPVLALPMAAVHRASKQASETEHLTLHDPMTLLPNRRLLLQRTGDALQQAAGGRQETALLILGLDRFQDVNDTLGRARGDGVMIEIADRLKRAVRSTDTVARVEGDRFGVLLPNLAPGADAATAAAEKIGRRSAAQIDVESATLSVDATVGIACAPRSRQRRRAAAPARGGGDVPREARAVAARVLLARARGGGAAPARARDRAEARHRHPRDHAPLPAQDRPRARHVVGVEALARWTDPVLGQVGPEHVRAARRAHRPRRAAHRRSRSRRPRPTAAAGRTRAASCRWR